MVKISISDFASVLAMPLRILFLTYANGFSFLVLRKKLEWLMQFGLLKKIPLVGPIFHKFVEENQDLVRQALSFKIKGLLALANKLFERFSLG